MNKINQAENFTYTNAHGTYGALLFDFRWKHKRQEILRRDGNKCVICNSNQKLQVHHRQYHYVRVLNAFKNPWEYPGFLMISLCISCHQRGHNKFKVPVLYI